MKQKIEKVMDILGEPEMLCQLAEECMELGEAALKLRRAMTGINPTPITTDEAKKDFEEEVAAVLLVLTCLNMLVSNPENEGTRLDDIQRHKLSRWIDRLEKNRPINRKEMEEILG